MQDESGELVFWFSFHKTKYIYRRFSTILSQRPTKSIQQDDENKRLNSIEQDEENEESILPASENEKEEMEHEGLFIIFSFSVSIFSLLSKNRDRRTRRSSGRFEARTSRTISRVGVSYKEESARLY